MNVAGGEGFDATSAVVPGSLVRIHYRRPPERLDVFEQRLVDYHPECIITLMERTPLPRPVRVRGRPILEPGSPVLWFTFPGLRHDVGRFHDAAGRFTGYYANLLTPVVLRSPLEWETTDLFLDVWLDASGEAELLDEDEFDAAVSAGWLSGERAEDTRREANALLAAARRGEFPTATVRAWTLERARRRLERPERHPVDPV